ncbi:sulfur oxidation c-type cytochrome SoxA [soil metagenome]
MRRAQRVAGTGSVLRAKLVTVSLAAWAMVAVAGGSSTVDAAAGSPVRAPDASASPTTPALLAPTDRRRSGFDFMTPEVQAMQRDDAQNPGMLWVGDGEALWSREMGASGKSCASCHGDAAASMRGVAARYPAFDDKTKQPISLKARIDACRADHQQAPPLPPENTDLLALESLVARQSRGLPIALPADPRLVPFVERGEKLFHQRMGQLDFSCAQCHDDRAGQRLGGSVIPQAHATGYPIYRLEWQGMGSLERRLRGCMSGVRAEPFAYGAAELTALQLYLAKRAAGMAMDAPAVRP